MEKLSINSSKKALLAVALVIFMLVAFLGLALTSTGAFAQAEGEHVTVSAEFSDESLAPHGDSTTTKLYYNTVSKALTVNTDTFTVDYTISVEDDYSVDGLSLKLYNAGFAVTGITVGETSLSGTAKTTISGVNYTPTKNFQSGSTANLIIDMTAAVDEFPVIHVTYKLTSAIDVFTHATLRLTGRDHTTTGGYENITSGAVEIYVRSETTMSVTATGKTYDATALATPTVTYTQTVSRSGDAVLPSVTEAWESGNQTDVGTYTYNASASDNDYFEAASASGSATISKLVVTVAPVAKTSIYSEEIVARTYSFTPASGSLTDFANRDAITVTFGGAGNSLTTASTVGTYEINIVSVTGTGIGNYNVTSSATANYVITRHNIAVPTVTIYNNGSTMDTTITANGSQDKTFNGKAYTFNYTVDPTDANSIAKYTSSGGASITAVGSSTLTLTVNSNYYWGAAGVAVGEQDTANKTFTINVIKKEITIYLHHASIQYRAALPTSLYYLGDDDEELDGGENLASIVIDQRDFGSDDYDQFDPVGNYNITLGNTNGSKTAIEAYLSNYTVSYDGEDLLEVTPYELSAGAAWIQFKSGDSTSMTYDKSAHGIEAVNTAYLFGAVEVCSVALTGGDNSNGTQTHVTASVGNAPAPVTLTATFALKTETNDDKGNLITANYSLDNKVVTDTITINRKEVTIVADDKSTTYGSAAPAFTSNASTALISGDTYSSTGSITCAYSATDESANRVVGTYDIVPSGWANNDYTISYTNGTLTVNALVATFTWSETKTWVYDGTSHTITASVNNAPYAHDVVTAATYTGNASATNVGNYSRTVATLGGADAANYVIDTEGSEDEAYTITVKTVTVTVEAASNFVYDSASHTVFTATVAGLIGDEDLTFAYDVSGHDLTDGSAVYTNGAHTFAAEWADDYTLVFTGITDGEDGLAANYTLSADSVKSMTIATYTYSLGNFTYSDANTTAASISWVALTDLYSDGLTFTYTVKKGETSKQSNSTNSFTTTESGTYTLDYAIADGGDGRAANYSAISTRPMTTLYVIELNDDDYDDDTDGHPHHGNQHSDIFIYAFALQALPVQTAWTEAGYAFDGWFAGEAQFANAGAAVSADAVYTAKWHVITYDVTYYYRLGTSGEFTQYGEAVTTTFYTDLSATPTKVWFASNGWHLGSMEGAVKTILDNPDDTAFYTEYSYAIGNGDVNGDGFITTADATILREYMAGGYGVVIENSISAAWAVSDAGNTGAATYILGPSANVDGDTEIFANDITAINQAIATGYAYTISDGAIVYNIQDSAVATGDKAITIGDDLTIASVTVNGVATDAYTYSDGVLTLTTALGSEDNLVIKTKQETNPTCFNTDDTFYDAYILRVYTKD